MSTYLQMWFQQQIGCGAKDGVGGRGAPSTAFGKSCAFFFVLFFGIHRAKSLVGRRRMWLSALLVEC